jgi:hypothetical protein
VRGLGAYVPVLSGWPQVIFVATLIMVIGLSAIGQAGFAVLLAIPLVAVICYVGLWQRTNLR